MTIEPVGVTDVRVLKSTTPRSTNEPERVRLMFVVDRRIHTDEANLVESALTKRFGVLSSVAVTPERLALDVPGETAEEDAREARDIIEGLPELIRQRQILEAQDDAALRSVERNVRDALGLS